MRQPYCRYMKKILFISEKTPADMTGKLNGIFDIRLLPPSSRLPAPVSCHPDMLIASAGSELVVCRYYYEENESVFNGVKVSLTDESHGAEYPADVLLNCFELCGKVYGREASASKYIKQKAANFVNVKQGYAHCSTLIFGDHAVTADEGIFKALTDNGADALKIRPGHIDLPGYGCGFIGGASFCFGNTVYFFGSLSTHPDGEMIREFITSRGYGIEELVKRPLIDLGGAAPEASEVCAGGASEAK